MRELQVSDYRLFVTVCHRYLPAADREIDHKVEPADPASASGGRPASGRSRDPRCQAWPYLSAAWQVTGRRPLRPGTVMG